MLSLLIQYAIATACLLFVVSLPIAKLPIASTLRRVAAALFLLAFLPSAFFGVFTSQQSGGEVRHATSGVNALEVIGGLLILSVIAYAILAVRKRMKKSPKDAWSEYVGLRSSGKRPVGTDPRTTHSASLFEEEP